MDKHPAAMYNTSTVRPTESNTRYNTMTFGQIMKDLRRKHDMTQEGLAETLGITGQAVSRWENDLAMPDISLLPVLANLFDVTTDYLLGVDITQKESKINGILRRSTQKGKEGHHMEAVEIIREGLKDFPGSYKLMYWLMFHLHFGANAHPDAEERKKLLREPISLGEKILAECTDNDLRHKAVSDLCACYAAIGEQEKMKKLADTMPDIWKTREFLMALYTRGDEQYEAKCHQVRALLNAAAVELSQLHFRHDTRSTWAQMSPEAILANQKNALAIADMLCPDGDYGELDYTRVHAFETMAELCFESGEWDAALEHLEKAITLVIYLDTDYDETKHHTSPLFCGQRYGGYMPNMPLSFAQNFLNLLRGQSYYDRLTATDKGRELVARLEAHAQVLQ